MKSNVLRSASVLVAATMLLVAASDAEARRRARSRSYVTDKSFGIGIMLGAPSGLSAKLFLDDRPLAIDFGLGVYDDHYGYDDDLHAHFDVLWHPAVIVENATLAMPFYLGVGARFFEHDYYRRDRYYDEHVHAGLRVPFGVALDFRNAPIDVFFELVPVFDFLNDDYYDDDFDLTAAIGVRFFF